MEESKKVRRLEDNIGNAGSLYRCDRIAKKNVVIFTSFMKDRLYHLQSNYQRAKSQGTSGYGGGDKTQANSGAGIRTAYFT